MKFKCNLLFLLMLAAVFAHTASAFGQPQAETGAGFCERILGHAKIFLNKKDRSQMDGVIEAYGGPQALWKRGDGQSYQGLPPPPGSGTGFQIVKQGLDRLSIRSGLTLDPSLNANERSAQWSVLSAAYYLTQADPLLSGFSFPERVKIRIAAAVYLNETDLQPRDFIFDPMKTPQGRKFFLDGNARVIDVSSELIGFAGGLYSANPWGWWEFGSFIRASESKGPTQQLYGPEKYRQVSWLLNRTKYSKPADMNLDQIRLVRTYANSELQYFDGRLISMEVLLKEPDGSWKPLLFEVTPQKELKPIKSVNGEPLANFCMRCHTGLREGRVLPSFIHSMDDLLREIRPARLTTSFDRAYGPSAIFPENLEHLLHH